MANTNGVVVQQDKTVTLLDEVTEGFRRKLTGGSDFEKQNANKILAYFDSNRTIVVKKIKEYEQMGLSYADKDFYILVRGNEVQMPLDYKAYAKVIVQSANEKGYDVIIEADVVREGYTGGYIKRQENGDQTLVLNNPIVGAIAMPWAKYKVISQISREIVSSKIEIVPQDEYRRAMQAGGKGGVVGQIHQNYATEGAKKIAVRRITKHLAYLFPALRTLELIDDESQNFDTDYSYPPTKEQHDPISGEVTAQPKRPSMDDM